MGDPYSNEVELFVGDVSMSSRSDAVEGKRWWEQNSGSRFHGHAYAPKLDENLFTSEEDNENQVQSCVAEINVGSKIDRDFSIFNRSYDAVMGARTYSSDEDTDFVDLPENLFVWEFGEPTYIAEEIVDKQALSTPDSASSLLSSIAATVALVTFMSF